MWPFLTKIRQIKYEEEMGEEEKRKKLSKERKSLGEYFEDVCGEVHVTDKHVFWLSVWGACLYNLKNILELCNAFPLA